MKAVGGNFAYHRRSLKMLIATFSLAKENVRLGKRKKKTHSCPPSDDTASDVVVTGAADTL